jgi:pyruvyltransferase
VAEAFGIPARYIRLVEPSLKYEDYYAATGRSLGDVAISRDAALEMGGMPPPRFDWRPLLQAFPLDLWGGVLPARSEAEIAAEVRAFEDELRMAAA